MDNRSIALAAAAISALLLHAASGFSGQSAGAEIPFHLQRHRIVVEASARKLSGLKLMIDTASTCSVVDRKIIRKLGLSQDPGEHRISAYGQITTARRFRLPELRIGPVFATVHCMETDLALPGVDGIIGLDLLRRGWLARCDSHEVLQGRPFTIDFERRELRFHMPQQLEHTIALEAPNSRLVVPVNIQGRSFRLAVDTGVDIMILFHESKMAWLESYLVIQRAGTRFEGAVGPGKDVFLQDLALGASRWSRLSAILLNLPDQTIDGVLSVSQLGLKILHFDFERNLMSWKK